VNTAPGANIKNLSFVTDAPNKLECYITQVWKGLPAQNTLAYWAHFKSLKENEVL
jgi:hypothetical protein